MTEFYNDQVSDQYRAAYQSLEGFLGTAASIYQLLDISKNWHEAWATSAYVLKHKHLILPEELELIVEKLVWVLETNSTTLETAFKSLRRAREIHSNIDDQPLLNCYDCFVPKEAEIRTMGFFELYWISGFMLPRTPEAITAYQRLDALVTPEVEKAAEKDPLKRMHTDRQMVAARHRQLFPRIQVKDEAIAA